MLARTAKSMFADPSNLFVASITRQPLPRFDEFLAEFPNRQLSVSIDEADWTPVFDAFARLSRTILPAICWHASDVDPETPGPQYDCTFTATIQGNQWRLPPCVFPGDQFCWMLRPQMGCFPEPGLDTEFPPWGDFVFRPAIHAECVVLE